MRIVRNIEVPTGNILIVEGEHGLLECLSLADYGKEVNVKCDAMGLTRKPDPVRHTKLLPLTEKWVITVSTQYGCSMGCQFCDVPKVGPGRNARCGDMIGQLEAALQLHPEVKHGKRLNIHFARMGEPTWNGDVLVAARQMVRNAKPHFKAVHPVISTMMPRGNPWLQPFLRQWMWLKNEVWAGDAGLQLSINSTDEDQRDQIFNRAAMPLYCIESICDGLPKPVGRKNTLNFAVADDYKVDAQELASVFDPQHWLCKLTPMHKTTAAIANGIQTAGDYTTYEPYEDLEQRLKGVGFDVLVFIASREEDEGRITCGNAILSGTEPFDRKPLPAEGEG